MPFKLFLVFPAIENSSIGLGDGACSQLFLPSCKGMPPFWLVERHPMHLEIAGSIPSHGTCQSCGLDP